MITETSQTPSYAHHDRSIQAPLTHAGLRHPLLTNPTLNLRAILIFKLLFTLTQGSATLSMALAGAEFVDHLLRGAFAANDCAA